jgi:hypothetical protein
VGLEFQTLWAEIDTAVGQDARRCLRRSGTAPLKVVIRPPWKSSSVLTGSGGIGLCQSLALHSSRLRELHVLEDSMDQDNGVIECFQAPAPHLRRLSLSAHWSIQGTLPIIFGGNFPQLNQLILDGATHWAGNSFKNLTSFSLHRQPFDRPLTRDLYDLLAASPSLSELFISFRTTPIQLHPSINGSLPQAPIVLNQMKTLYIRAGYASQLVPLVSRLVLPPGVKLCFSETCVRFETPNEFHNLFRDNLGGLHNFSKLRIECKGTFGLKVSGVSGPTLFTFHLQCRATTGDILELLDYLFTIITASPIIELQLEHFDSLDMGGVNWSNRLRIPSLEHLTLIGNENVSDGIISGLLPLTNTRGETEVPCPDLSVLEVLCPMMKGGPIPSLASAITQRRANFCSLQLVRLSQAHFGITVDDMAQMRNHVTVDIATDLFHISSTEFQELVVFRSLWLPKW